MSEHARILIIGSGPAGYTAAIYAARAGLEPVLVSGLEQGGQMTITTDVENYPGFADIVQGPWLMDQMRMQAEHAGTRLLFDIVTGVDAGSYPFGVVLESGGEWTADALVIATGARARWLGVAGEEYFTGHGVSACATCDGPLFRGKRVVVVGGGNTAVEEALYLTQHVEAVTLIHRRDRLRAEKVLRERLLANAKVSVLWDHVVEEVVGDVDRRLVAGVRVRHVVSGAVQELGCEGVFVAIGHDPATGLFRGVVDMDSQGYICTEADSTCTSVAGIFAAGDAADRKYRQAVTAAGTGCMAAIEAGHFLMV